MRSWAKIKVAAAAGAVGLVLGACGGQGTTTGPTAPTVKIPVGYDHPESDQGGPALQDGRSWLEQVWPRYLKLVPQKFAGGKPTVMVIGTPNCDDKIYSLGLRFPIDALIVQGGSGMDFGGRETFYALLKSRPKVDCFVISRMHPGTIPAEVQYEILRRVKEEGAGLVVIDLFDASDTLNSGFLGLTPTEKGTAILSGIPYDGFRNWDYQEWSKFLTYNYWYGNFALNPTVKPQTYGETSISPFGKGRIVWSSTNSHWQRHGYARTLLPQISQNLSMWVDNDYYYSHAVKAMLAAMGYVPAARIQDVAPKGEVQDTAVAVVTLANASGKPFAGKLKWQLRDTWGVVSDRGEQSVAVTEAQAAIKLEAVHFADAGRRFLDLWVENGVGETVDWGSTIVEVNRGVAAPAITFKYPDGAPRGADLTGTISVKDSPPGAKVKATLVDRYWREVAQAELPAGEAMPYCFPSKGLDGQIWRLQADVSDAAGHVLARGYLELTSPHTRATRAGFHPLITCVPDANPEAAAYREYFRRIGFMANRPYSPGNEILAITHAYNDLQLMPFFCAVTCASSDYRNDAIGDWEDPERKRELQEGAKLVTGLLRKYGNRGLNLTDDASAAQELPKGAYTAIKFHEWLQRAYGGDFAAVCQAWGWTPAQAQTPDDELPYDPYVVVQFHQWLKAKYGNLEKLSQAWQLPVPPAFGSLHLFGTIERDMIKDLKDKGNAVPATDAAAFMAEHRKRGEPANPWGQINHATVKAAYEQGVTAGWIDARNFLCECWKNYMVWVKDAARSVNPDSTVGSDASFYGAALPEIFAALDYVAPYYDDHAVKIAISRGRMRRAGDFGACLGSYGEKPANMCGRRATIWQILFAGGNAFYYWMFVPYPGMNPDMTLSVNHAKFQCEVTEEVMDGIGELFTGCPRIFDPIAILDSKTSDLCDELEKKDNGQPLSAMGNSMQAFQAICEDQILNPHTITPDELTGGWLERNGTRLLILPAINSLSDAEAQAIRKFVGTGGTVVADVRPGARYPNGNLRTNPVLDDVFGATTDPAIKEPRVRGKLMASVFSETGEKLDFGEALADPRLKPISAIAYGQLANAPVVMFNSFGQGRAILLNASFSSYATYRSESGEIWQPWYEVMKKVVEMAGIKPAFFATSEGKETPGFEFSPFKNGAGYLLGVEDLATGDFVGPRRPFELKLPGIFNVYDIRTGQHLGALDTLKADLPRGGHRAYALMPYVVDAVDFTVDQAKVKRGGTVTLRVDPASDVAKRDLHVIRINAAGPDGKDFFPFKRVLKAPAVGALEVPLTLALNDAPGEWTFTAVDINSGKRAVLKITVE